MPLLWLSIAFLTGILLGAARALTLGAWISLTALAIAFALLAHKFPRTKPAWQRASVSLRLSPGLLLVALAFGGLRSQASALPVTPDRLAWYNDHGSYTVTARVNAPPDIRQDAVYLELESIEIEDPRETDPARVVHTVSGSARARFASGADWKIGDVLRFIAEPLTPPDSEGFSYRDYLARQGISTIFYYPRQVQRVNAPASGGARAWLESARQYGRRVIFAQLPQPESALLSGILLGLDRDLPGGLVKAYQQTGTAHIIAISGFNMAVLASFFTLLFSKALNRYWTAVLSALALVTYTVFVGGSPSVVRAAVMAITAFGGHLLGRRQAGVNALGFTAALMCLVNPLLLGDVSFQLSFAATLGLVLLAEPLQTWLKNLLEKRFSERAAARVSGSVSEYFLFTLAAQLFVLPVIAFHFGRVSISSLLANPLILPVQPLLLVMGGISTIAGAILPALGRLLSGLVWPLAAYTNRLVEWLAQFSSGSLAVTPATAVWIGVFLALFIILFVFRNYFTKIFRGRLYWVMFLLALAVVSLWSAYLHRPDGLFHLHLIRAGEETVLFVRTPTGQNLMFDPGREVNELSAAVSRELSPWHHALDQVWLTRPGATDALEYLDEQLPLKTILVAPVVYQSGAETKPLSLPPGISVEKLPPRASIEYGGGLSVRLVAEDLQSTAYLITHGDIRVLVPNGVDYALIKETDPAVLDGLFALVLSEDDLSYIPPRVWQALVPGIILWNSAALCPVEGWLAPAAGVPVGLVSDTTGLLEPER